MKNLSIFSLLVMIGILLFNAGCSEDEKYVSKVYDDPFFQKSYVTNLLKKEGTLEHRTSGTSDVDELIDKVNLYIQNKSLGQTKTSIQQRYGYPVWNATEFIREPNKVTTITPIVNVSSGVITNFFLTSSTKPGVNLILNKYTPKNNFLNLQQYFVNKMNGVENDISFRGTGESSGISGSTGSGPSFDCETHVELTTLYWAYWHDGLDLGLSGSFTENTDGSFTHDVETPWGVMTTDYDIEMYQHCFGNDSSADDFLDGPGTTTSGGGPSGGASCAICNISSWEDCKEKMNKIYGDKNFNSSEELVRKELFDRCQGCAVAYLWTSEMVSIFKNSTSEKVKCLMCGGNWEHINAVMNLKNLKMPCIENQEAFIDNLIPPCGGAPQSNSGEPFSWKNIKNKLNGQAWFTDVNYPRESSKSIKDMGNFYGLSYNEIRDMEDEDICNKLTIMDCLKPSTLGEVYTISNQEKAQLLDFYKNAELLNPCTGEVIDKDGLFINLCENNGVSLAGLDAALENISYVNLSELPIHKSDCSKTDEQNIADFNNYMQQNGGCSGTGFQNALSSFLGIGNTLDQNIPPLSSTNRICPNSIIVTPSTWEPNRQNVAGISNLQISLNNGINLTFQNLFFKVDHTRDCSITTEQLISNAINNAIQIANNNLNAGNPIFGNGLNNNIQFTRLVEEQMKSIANNSGCMPKANPNNNQTTNVPPFAAQAIPSSYGNATIGSEHCGARFVQFSAMQTGC